MYGLAKRMRRQRQSEQLFVDVVGPETGPQTKVYVRRSNSEKPAHNLDEGSGRYPRSTTLPDSEWMMGESHGDKGRGWDSRVEHQNVKTFILRRTLACVNPGLRLAKISRSWESR